MPIIVNDTVKGSLDIKRMNLPGVVVEDDCPKCGKKWTFNGKTDYVSYPILGDKINLYGWCDCGADWDVHVTIGIRISL